MSRKSSSSLVLAAIFLVRLLAYAGDPPATGQSRLLLHDNWQLQSSCEDRSTGDQISRTGFDASRWHQAQVPGTVVGSLVEDKTYKDPFFGNNLKSLPGMNYAGGELSGLAGFFANQDMPKGSPFSCSWWYRTEFVLPADFGQGLSWLHFLGINYRANIWLNGTMIASNKDVAGPYRTFEFEVTRALRAGSKNSLAVEISAPDKNDPGLTWVDWAPTPADKNMGIWREVFLTETGSVSLGNAFVNSKLDAEYKTATLIVSADVSNASDRSVTGTLRVDFEDGSISQPVTLAPNESRTVRFTPEQFKELHLSHPKLWWPYQMGEPNLSTARLAFKIQESISDSARVIYGIREVTSELTPNGHRLFKVNGHRVLIRGAAWTPDLFLRWSRDRVEADLRYVKDMGLNAIRLEGKIDREEFFETTDRLGILVMTGWTCCDAWERWDDWTPDTRTIAAASLRDQVNRLRTHPSVFVWLYGSDNPPPPDIEKMYLDILSAREWPNPSVSSANDTVSKVTGGSGVKMTGPYEYVPPVYWLTDKDAGGAYGYNTETSPGPAIPTVESLKKFIPAGHLWPIDVEWSSHAGGDRFTTINVFKTALDRRYGEATSLEDFERKAQAMTYDGQRAMYEAYGRNKYTSTGVIQWMLNNPWPSLIWHLYDYYQVPAGGYFGTKKSTEVIHVQYSYDDNSVAVVNGLYEPMKGVRLVARLYDIHSKEKASREATLDLAPDAATKVFDLPVVDDLSTTYFLKLDLRDAAGRRVSDNFYWLSRKPDTLDWNKRQDSAYTPQKDYGDLTGLNTLPQVQLGIAAVTEKRGTTMATHVTVKNSSQSIAFMIHPRVTQGKGGDDVVPIFWEDNYFSLLPGEERTVTAKYDLSALHGKDVGLSVDGFNVAATASQSILGMAVGSDLQAGTPGPSEKLASANE